MRMTKVGEETTLGQIAHGPGSESREGPHRAHFNRYAKSYMPAALVLGAVVWWWSGDILRADHHCDRVLSVCHGAATDRSQRPIGNAARRGSLVQKLQPSRRWRSYAVAFDKTGTSPLGSEATTSTPGRRPSTELLCWPPSRRS